MQRRKSTRIYNVGNGRVVEITKEWAWTKPATYWWYVMPYQDAPRPSLGKFASFKEARQFVRDLANA